MKFATTYAPFEDATDMVAPRASATPPASPPQTVEILNMLARRFGVACARLDLTDGRRVSGVSAAEGDRFCDADISRWLDRVRGTGQPLTLADARATREGRMPDGRDIGLYVGLQVHLASAGQGGVLSLIDAQPRAAGQAHALAVMLERAAKALDRSNRADALQRMEARIAAQDAVIARQQAQLTHTRKIFDRASEAARIGVWECDLPDETLHWTDVVYDIFEMPRGAPLVRSEIVKCYTEASRRELERLRSRAIAERGHFTLDAEINTLRGNRRWMRITASVECENGEPVRIFGMKQDITDEKLLSDRMKYLAEFDALTGLANRAQFQATLAEAARDPSGDGGALLVIDLDGFKEINDTHGHIAGDQCLKEVGRRLQGLCGAAGLVARIGGDEFAVIVNGNASVPPSQLAVQIVEALRQPVLHQGCNLQFGASIGIAPTISGSPTEVFRHADIALYAAKAAGRNRYHIFGTAETRDSA